MFSRSCEYALQSVIYIGHHSKNGEAVGLLEISKNQKIPKHFLSKILQLLVKNKILISIKGPNGGFMINGSASKLKLIKIVSLIDGKDIFDRCGIGLKKCSDKSPCPIHKDYKVVKERIKSLLSEKSLSELSEEMEKGKSMITL